MAQFQISASVHDLSDPISPLFLLKSLLVSAFWPAWEWIRFPKRRWLFSSYAAAQALTFSCSIRSAPAWIAQRR